MPFYSKKDFALLTGILPKNIMVYKSRRKIVIEDNNLIDSDNQTNRLFIEEREVAMAKTGKTPQIGKGADVLPKEGKKEGENGQTLIDLVEKKKELDIEKIAEEIKILRVKHEKITGEVIPVAPIETLVYQFKHYIITNQKIAFEKFLIEVGHKYELQPEDIATYRGNNVKLLNNAIATASNLFVNDLGKIITTFTAKRGAGERL